ncbi:L-idonate 5-dehydrogenase [Acuticoccus mangrovi]|uniref:L-idonate 5-dehydrogenase n=1 Tax=Acuticoccus mangrovi TaxID=2796142 RepID=A0A934MGU3_9HYPH|nr:L-idonate 5-dehydrogenase [Acuticoccus mangrovi]MBJ3776275.1 L-idonate 5-dehydrogenase [Acuticoccus mangrovi]
MTATRVLRLHAVHDIRVEEEPVAAPGPGDVLIAMERGGICGSDLHYFHAGRAGSAIVRDPIILGHEASGRIAALGAGVGGLAVGDLVAVNPSRPCGSCRFCLAGKQNQCLEMRFLGSAMFRPHENGAFRDLMTVPAERAVPMPNASAAAAACVEPLSVCLHAAHQAPSLLGAKVLVTGAGPIGALMVAVARAAGAARIVATDLAAAPLAVAEAMGADETVNVAESDALSVYAADKGTFDVGFECTAAAPAIRSMVECVAATGTMVQVGIAADITVPLNLIVAKEIAFKGSFRFHAEFGEAAGMIDGGRIDVTPILTGTLPLADAEAAFALAGDRARAVKVQLAFGG